MAVAAALLTPLFVTTTFTAPSVLSVGEKPRLPLPATVLIVPDALCASQFVGPAKTASRRARMLHCVR